MKFLLLFGPQAVGKMTVGQELTKITDLKLFHNHMTIDLLVPLFGFTREMWQLCHMFREEIFRAYANSGQYGIIFTTVWKFDDPEKWKYIRKACDVFRSSGADIYFVELEASVEERLKRNRTDNRLKQKQLKRDIVASEHELLDVMKKYRLNSTEGEITEKNYLRINNTELCAEEVAQLIKQKFRLE